MVLAAILGGNSGSGQHRPLPDGDGDNPSSIVDIFGSKATSIPRIQGDPGVRLACRDPQSQPLTAQEVYAKVNPSVVTVVSEQADGASIGTGVIMTSDGYIITNAHVISGGKSCWVALDTGVTYEVNLVGFDEEEDLAVLKADPQNPLPAAEFGNSDLVQVGDTAYAIGNPLGELTFSMSQGIVSCCDRAINVDGTPFNMIQVDASINPGNSGGPLMNLYGEVVGIVSAKYSSYSNTTVEGIGFAIPISDVQTIITDIMENGQVTDKAYMAIKAGSMTEQMAAQYNIDVTKGVFVYAVEKGGAGEKAGLQLGDVITKLNDTEITSMSDLSMAKKGFKAGDTVTLTVWRGGQEITLSLTFDQQPQTTGTEDDSSNQNQGQQDSYGDLYDYFFGRGNGGRGN